MRNCGKCKYFSRLRNSYIIGLCEFYDCGTKSDCGHKCKSFKAKKYKRSKIYIEI